MRSDDPVGLIGDTDKRTPSEKAINEEANHLVAHKLGVIECPYSLIDKALEGISNVTK
ncbi:MULTISPECIES: hypothetical protein [Vibrio harveyi group]|uniref:hypothetical protein n=1 Tax=Vibrio harveyi group TaxID=717610 RepID=UPI0003A0F6B8|nr:MULTISPECIES: hypothetical protein [Vibrio harveyi group]